MKLLNDKSKMVSAFLIATGLAALLAFPSSTRGVEKSPSWKISGELEEACSCRPACPCWFKSLPSRMTCDGMQVVIIKKGHFGKVSLDGLALGEFVQSPEHKTMFESFGNWNFDYVYIDEKANEEQREALKQIAAHLFPNGAKCRQYRFVSITREINGNEHVTKIGKYGVCSGHLIDGGYNGAPKVVNPPLADPTHEQFLQGQTTQLTYADAGQDWKYENSNYMWNKFTVNDKQYARHEAMMMKKMGKM